MTFHCVGLPHTEVTKEFSSCAYTTKCLNFCKMMKSLGHTVYLYGGGERTDAPCEFISCISKDQQKIYFGDTDIKKDFYPLKWEGTEPYWTIMNGNAIREIKLRAKQRDFICLIAGTCQQPIAVALNNLAVEFGVGYQGVFSKYRVFESYAWMHYVYGLNKTEDGRYFDAVIPNYFNVEDFPFSEKKEDYYVYLGRMIERKGVHIAVELCKKMGKKLILAGQGKYEGNIGTVDIKQRGELLSKATAVFVPTQYIEPFGGVHIEAMLCGTPVITTDWGVFTETITNGFNGYRTRTFGEMKDAMEKVKTLDFKKIREWAVANYSLERVAQQYQAYFNQLNTLWAEGWYNEQPLTERYTKIWEKF